MALELTRKSNGGKKPGNGGQKNDVLLKIMEVFEKNPFLKILVPALLFLIIAAILIFIIWGDGVLLGKDDTPDSPAIVQPASNEVDIFPDDNGISDEGILSVIKSDPLSADILASAEYTGWVTGRSGLKTALIQIGNSKDQLVLAIGETVGDSKWELAEISEEYVVFKAGDNTKKITRK